MPRAEVWLLILAALPLCGCSSQDLETYYGRHQIPVAAASVNGTDVLAGMFGEMGNSVYFRGTLVTSEMEAADTVVWFPNDYAVPREEVIQWFDEWLSGDSARTLVYVGRDFTAAPLYWQFMQQHGNPKLKREFQMRERDAQDRAIELSKGELTAKDDEGDADEEEDEPVDPLDCDWFLYREGKLADVKSLSGPWAAGIDAAQAEIQLGTTIVPKGRARRLLASNGKLLVGRMTRRRWPQGQILLVANGSFLLNLPLVNHEHRKLAGKLIAATGEPGRVVFLESGPGGPPIDPPQVDQSLWTLFGAWPLSAILLQLAVLGVIFCFARWPIFGHPRHPAAETTSDFAQHVAAVGQLLARTRDARFAREPTGAVEIVQPSEGPSTSPQDELIVPRRVDSSPSIER